MNTHARDYTGQSLQVWWFDRASCRHLFCQLCFTGRCCIDTTAQQFILCFVGNTSLILVNGDKQSYQKTLLTDANDINDSI